jgi:CRISPR-associated protein Cmr5
MSITLRSQQLAQTAYARVAAQGELPQEYVSFAKSFPALIHTCGLAQAVAFAFSKNKTEYIGDLAAVLQAGGHVSINSSTDLQEQSHNQPLAGYLRLSRDALHAADWLKRYAEAIAPEEKSEND